MVRAVGFFGNLDDPGEARNVAGCSGGRGGRNCALPGVYSGTRGWLRG